MGGSLPQYIFADEIGVPYIWSAYANWDQQNHGPNENMDLGCFLQAIKISATVLHRLTIA